MEKFVRVIRAELLKRAEESLTADWGTDGESQCASQVRRILWHTPPNHQLPPSGLDARAQYMWFLKQGLAIADMNGSVPGDLLYFWGEHHGRHGHVCIRVLGNRVIENSIIHFHETGKGRGTRQMLELPPISGIVRLWRN